MYHNRLIPCLLLEHGKLVKTRKFGQGRYVGDPINAVKIFNDKEVDELVFLDICATREKHAPDFEYLKKITAQCFMPLCYGGGVTNLEEMKELFRIGFEKVAINTASYKNIQLLREASKIFGSQSIVGAMDVGTTFLGKKVVKIMNGKVKTEYTPLEYALRLEEAGVGEIFFNSITRDGTMEGYDYQLIEEISEKLSIPVIACGGAGKLEDCKKAIDSGASAAAAGSIFVFWGKNQAILINYPDAKEINRLFNS